MNISWKRIEAYRVTTYRTTPEVRLCSIDEAIRYVNDRGFIFFWPGKEAPLPSLWNATAGDRPVPDEHDDPGHKTWDWKDTLLDKKRWYYGRILDNRNTIISLEILPYFYALSPNYGDYELDYLEMYDQGKMSQPAKMIYEALLSEGPMDTLALRKASRMMSDANKSAFLKNLNDLQRTFQVLPVGISRSGGWRYAFIYDIPARYFPDLPQKASMITVEEARERIAAIYLTSVGAAQKRHFSRLFHWSEQEIHHLFDRLSDNGEYILNYQFGEIPGKWVVLGSL